MKGCLDPILKIMVFFVLSGVFSGSIYSLIRPSAPSSLERDRSLRTAKERIEIQKFHNEMRIRMSESNFYSFPPAFLTTYLIFRKKKKGRGDHKPRSD